MSCCSRKEKTILLADDERSVRLLARKTLEKRGYRVIETCDGQKAVERFRDHRHEVCLALLDFRMPRRDGFEALAAMRDLVPGLPAIVMSGDWGRSGDGAELVHATLLSKPFPISRLISFVRSALETPRALMDATSPSDQAV